MQRIKKICSDYSFKHINADGQTAEEVFAQNNENLITEAKEWLQCTAKDCSSIVAVLIVTVTFASAYTIPGGSNEDTGTPVLLNQPFFVIFTISNVLSLTFTLTSVIMFLSIITSPFHLEDFRRSLPRKLKLGVMFLIFAVSMMILTFEATIILMIHNKEGWAKFASYAAAFFPPTLFTISYLPYFSLMETFKHTLAAVFPPCSIGGRILIWIANLFNFRNSHPRIPPYLIQTNATNSKRPPHSAV